MKTVLNQLKITFVAAVALLVLFLAFLWAPFFMPAGTQESGSWDAEAPPDPFAEVISSVGAKSFLVFDFKEGKVIASRRPHMQWPLASLTKLMTAVAAKELIEEGARIKVDLESILKEGDSGFLAGEEFLRDDLTAAMIISSSNDAASAIARHIGEKEFVAFMNKKANELKMVQTYFINPSGLDTSQAVSGAYGSAEDLMILLEYILQNRSEILDAARKKEVRFGSFLGRKHRFENTNRLTGEIPQLIGGKTGFTDIAGGNLAVVADMGLVHPIGIVVLGSSEEGRFEDVLKLYKATVNYYANLQI